MKKRIASLLLCALCLTVCAGCGGTDKAAAPEPTQGDAVTDYLDALEKDAESANSAADLQALDSIRTAAVFSYTEAQIGAGKSDVAVERIELTAEDGEIRSAQVNGSDLTEPMLKLVGGSWPVLKTEAFRAGAVWTERDGWQGADAAPDA